MPTLIVSPLAEEDLEEDRDERLARCARREGLDWGAMGEEERQRFTDKLLNREPEAS